MDAFASMLLCTTASGVCSVVGGLLARVEQIMPLWLEREFRHTIVAFGGGILIAAISFALVPAGQAYFGAPLSGVAVFLAGGLVFMQVERQLSAKQRDLPEGFNAYREILVLAGNRQQRTLTIMLILILPGPAAGMPGWAIAPAHPEIVGATMLFASGGILYLLFQAIAPQSRLERHWAPTLGAVLGF